MKKTITTLVVLLFIVSTLSSCFVNKFDVGKGAQSNVRVTEWNHYVIEGLVPVGVSNPQTMAGGATDYTVTIKHTFLNMFIAALTGGIYYPTTTIVQK